GPVINQYVKDLKESIGEDVPLEFFTSSGGTVRPEAFTGRRALLSGPAGGAVAVKALSEALGIPSSVGFDMGGTSTDVCRYHRFLSMVYEKDISGIEIKTEMVDINTIASGGGSVLWFDGQRLRVGPHSAGADPGPACYGFGGPPTITDANLITGRIVTEFMPETFGPDRKGPISRDASLRAIEDLCRKVSSETGRSWGPEELALGYLQIANEMMANAIKEMTLAKGLDVRDFVLVGFGGAAGQHACFVAEKLQMKEVILHPLAGLFSALGIALARPTLTRAITFIMPFREEAIPAIEEAFRKEEQRASLGEDYVVIRQLGLRVKNSEGEITVQWASYGDMLQEFVHT
ncbi:MAG: 5-oxoprolinase, partial [Nitrospirae bacterium]